MRYKIKRYMKPSNLVTIFGFSLSMAAVMVGISSILRIIQYAGYFSDEIPIYQTVQNSGLSVMIFIYLFSIANCMAAVHYRMIAEKKIFAVKKAFGATNYQVLKGIAGQMSINLVISLWLGSIIILILIKIYPMYFYVDLSFRFIFSTISMLLFTFVAAMVLPVFRVMKIYPAEVVK